MNRLFSLSLLLLLAVLAPRAVAQEPAHEPGYELGVDGMSCPLCVYGLEKQLHRLDGVDTVTTDLAHGRIVVAMHEGKSLALPQVEQAVRSAGFSLAGFSLRSFAPTEPKPQP